MSTPIPEPVGPEDRYAGDTSSSPTPGTPQTADKASTGAGVSFAIALVLLIAAFYYDDRNGTNLTEVLLAALGAAGVGGATGLSVFKKRNKPKPSPRRKV